MRFSHKRMVKRQIRMLQQKYKHQVEFDAVNVNMSGVVTTNVPIVGLDNPVLANTTNVQAKAKVQGFYFELHVFNASAAPNVQYFHWNFQASPQSGIGAVNPNGTGSSSAKNYVFKSGMIPVSDSVKTGKVFGFIKIPAKYSRFMNTDVIYFNVTSQYNLGNTDGYHLKVIYKEIRG